MGVLKRLTSTTLYPGPRDLFGLEILRANRDFIGEAVDRAYRSTRGHILVRVEPGGERYWTIILDDTTESYRVIGVHGPYESRQARRAFWPPWGGGRWIQEAAR
jgi:hypothetical protein